MEDLLSNRKYDSIHRSLGEFANDDIVNLIMDFTCYAPYNQTRKRKVSTVHISGRDKIKSLKGIETLFVKVSKIEKITELLNSLIGSDVKHLHLEYTANIRRDGFSPDNECILADSWDVEGLVKLHTLKTVFVPISKLPSSMPHIRSLSMRLGQLQRMPSDLPMIENMEFITKSPIYIHTNAPRLRRIILKDRIYSVLSERLRGNNIEVIKDNRHAPTYLTDLHYLDISDYRHWIRKYYGQEHLDSISVLNAESSL